MCNLFIFYFKNWSVNMTTLSLSYYFCFHVVRNREGILLLRIFWNFSFKSWETDMVAADAEENKGLLLWTFYTKVFSFKCEHDSTLNWIGMWDWGGIVVSRHCWDVESWEWHFLLWCGDHCLLLQRWHAVHKCPSGGRPGQCEITFTHSDSHAHKQDLFGSSPFCFHSPP